jgi:predicted outer membrane repeat protein
MLRPILRYGLVVTLASIALLAVNFPLQPSRAQAKTHSLTIVCASSIQACLDAASDGDTVVIPAGTYTESLTLSKAISLTGINSMTTIIHAIAGQRVLTVTGAPISTSIVISGLTLMGGQADTGGGLFADRPVTLINMRFISNTASLNGGGLAAGTVVVFDSQFIGNAAFDSGLLDSGGGGGLSAVTADITRGYFENNTTRGLDRGNGPYGLGGGVNAVTLTLTDTQLISNAAIYGGGAAAWITHIHGSQFERNAATQLGGGLFASQADVTETTFISNSTTSWGGGAYVSDLARIVDSRFEGNHAISGGAGLASFGDPFEITGTQFTRNATDGYGGGLAYSYGSARIVNALFVSNTAGLNGAALYLVTGQMDLLHTTIAGPHSNPGTALFNLAATLHITNTIIANHALGINSGGATTEDYNLFYGNLTKTIGITLGVHSLIGDPHFIDPLQNDYHLRFDSPAIDHGIDTGVYLDLDGSLRPIGFGFEIGAYEYLRPIHYIFLPMLRHWFRSMGKRSAVEITRPRTSLRRRFLTRRQALAGS